MTSRLPHNLNVTFDGVDGEQLLIGLDDVAVSSGAACSSSRRAPSHVLKALGLREAAAQASIRFGLGRFNTDEDIDYVVEKLRGLVARLRAPVPVFELEDDAPELPPGWAEAPDRPNRGGPKVN
jgi:cysteine desulfurase